MPTRKLLFGLALLLCLAAGPLLAAAPGEAKGGSESLLLAQIIVLILTGRLLGEAMLRIGQPAVMGELLAGILLGPSILGALWPQAEHLLFPKSPEQKAMIDAIAQFGILMLLLLAGMETDLALVRKVRRPAFTASLSGIALPFACGFALGEFLPDSLLPDPGKRMITALFLGTALSISSVKIVATVIREMGFIRRNVGQVILASAIVDDTIGWVIIATTLSLAEHGSFDWLAVGKSVIGTLAFLGVSFTVGRRAVFHLIRWTNDSFRGESPVIAAILLVMGAMALITHLIGVHTVLGAFVAGILVGESPILTRQIDEQLRGLTAGLFMPVFFGLAGLSTDLTILADGRLVLLALGLVLIASLGKAAGAFAGGLSGGLTARESLALATGMNARGSTEVIVASIGLGMGVVSQDLFTMIVAMAFITTMAMPPSLRWALKRLPIRKEERERLERESLEAKSFVPHIERILLAADVSAKGLFAARVAGLIAGSRGMPVTVLDPAETSGEATGADADTEDDPGSDADPKQAERAVKAAADGGDESAATRLKKAVAAAAEKAAPAPSEDEDNRDAIAVTARSVDGALHQAVAVEGGKGYDLMVVGVDATTADDGGFHDALSRVAAAFDGSLAVVVARGAHAEDPLKAKFSILAPLTGSEPSRRGVEMALALAKAAGSGIRALVVSAEGAATQRRRVGQSTDEDEIVKEVRLLGKLYGRRVKTVVRTSIAAEDAVLREARLGRHDLIVLGASRRPGDTLSLGGLARSLLESSDRSLIFVVPRMPRQKTAPAEGAQATVAPKGKDGANAEDGAKGEAKSAKDAAADSAPKTKVKTTRRGRSKAAQSGGGKKAGKSARADSNA